MKTRHKCCPQMLYVWYKFRHTEQQHNTMHTLFQFITRARLILVDGTTRWRDVKSLQHKLLWCTICCLKSAFHTFTPSTSMKWTVCNIRLSLTYDSVCNLRLTWQSTSSLLLITFQQSHRTESLISVLNSFNVRFSLVYHDENCILYVESV